MHSFIWQVEKNAKKKLLIKSRGMPGAKAGLQVVTCFRRQRRLLKFLFMAIDVAFISRHCFHLAWISSGWEQKAKLLCSVRKCSDEPLGLCSCFYLRGLMHSLYLRCAWDVCDDSGWQVAPWGHVGVVFRGECRWRWGQCRLIFRSIRRFEESFEQERHYKVGANQITLFLVIVLIPD